MKLNAEYHLHSKDKTWLKAKTVDTFGLTSSGEALFYLQELPTGEARVCFNTQVARKNGLNFSDLQDNFNNARVEDDKKFSSMKFKTTPAYFKDSKGNNMVFDDAVKQLLSNRFWTYSSDLNNGVVVDVSAAPFVNKDSAKGLFNLIKNNFANVINHFENSFTENHNKLSNFNIGIEQKAPSVSLKDKIRQIKEQSSIEQQTTVSHTIKPKL